MKLTEAELQELAKQLRCPDKDGGLKVADMMNVTNANIINKTVASLNFETADTVLEIGPGNGRHIAKLLQENDVRYFGADISQAMVSECNSRYSGNENIEIVLIDGNTLPFPDNFFNKVFTVNTIYFWEDPEAYALEIARAMKSGGVLSIGYIPERIMHNIPFAKYGFTLYNENKVRELLESCGFTIQDEITETEMVTSNSGQQILREFVIISAVKQ